MKTERISRPNTSDRVRFTRNFGGKPCTCKTPMTHQVNFLQSIFFINWTLISRTQYLRGAGESMSHCGAGESMSHARAQCVTDLDLHSDKGLTRILSRPWLFPHVHADFSQYFDTFYWIRNGHFNSFKNMQYIINVTSARNLSFGTTRPFPAGWNRCRLDGQWRGVPNDNSCILMKVSCRYDFYFSKIFIK